jgi:hypothetical protein
MRRLLGDLRSGKSCLCLFPQAQLAGAPATAEALLDELLHELADFVLVPAPGGGAVPDDRVPAPSPPAHSDPWGGMDPILDYDDGLSAFSAVRTHSAAVPEARATTAPDLRWEGPDFHALANRIGKATRPPTRTGGGPGSRDYLNVSPLPRTPAQPG